MRLILCRVRELTFVIEHLAEIAAVNAAITGRAADEMLGFARHRIDRLHRSLALEEEDELGPPCFRPRIRDEPFPKGFTLPRDTPKYTGSVKPETSPFPKGSRSQETRPSTPAP